MKANSGVANLSDAKEWFAVLRTGEKVQAAVMKLESGQSSGEKAEAHAGCEQVILVVEGEVEADLEGEKSSMGPGDFLLVRAGVRHRFTNKRSRPAVTFNTYSPPEY